MRGLAAEVVEIFFSPLPSTAPGKTVPDSRLSAGSAKGEFWLFRSVLGRLSDLFALIFPCPLSTVVAVVDGEKVLPIDFTLIPRSNSSMASRTLLFGIRVSG